MIMNLDNKKIWDSVLVDIELNISSANFKTWFKDLQLKEITDKNIVIIIVSSEFIKKWLLEKFNSDILKSFIKIKPEIRGIEYIIGKVDMTIKNLEKKTLRRNVINKKQIRQKESQLLNLTLKDSSTNLNPRYRFDNFVVGSFNEVAVAASKAVINREKVVYNPLFIYGNTGYGKTHLIQAVGNEIKEKKPEKKVFYITSERFYMDVIDFIGLKSNKTNNFKKKYREYDVFIMDDIQFLNKKERTQEELFHLFNDLYNQNKQIILSSDKHPNQISDLEERLRSRFNAGMIIDIQVPDYESRLRILEKKAKSNNFHFEMEIIEYIASNITGNIRELEGVLNNLSIQTDIKKRPLTILEVKDIIKNNYKKKQPIDYQKLVEIVSKHYNIAEENVYKKIRKREFVFPRQIIMYLLREDFGFSYPSIGEKLGGRDHTTAMHSYEKISQALKIDNELNKDIEVIRAMY